MPLGLGLLSGQRSPDDPRTWRDVYDELVAITVRAEEKGLDSVWTTEHHFVDDGYMPSLLVTSAAVAQATSTIAIGTGVVLAPLYHPLRLAEDAATVDLISGGRLILGLGLGWSGIEFAALGADLRLRGRAMDEILQILPKAWTGEPFAWEGRVYRFPEVGVRPAPEAPIPVVIGGTAEAAVVRAARYGDGFFSNASPETLTKQVATASAELERLGRDPAAFQWIYYAVVYPSTDGEEALPHVWHQRWKYSDMEASAARTGSVIPAAPPLDEAGADRMRKVSMIGTADQIVDSLNRVKQRVGVPLRLVARSHFPTLPLSRQMEIVDQLAEEVAPHV